MTDSISPSLDLDKSINELPPASGSRLYSITTPPSLAEFKKLTIESKASHYPLCSSIEKSIPMYRLPSFSSTTSEQRSALQDEWYHILLSGPGVFIVKDLCQDLALLNRVNKVFASIIASEKQAHGQRGDHFANAGANDRIWNSFQKHCSADPDSFLQYYSNPWLPLIASAWLGPYHRLTAQVNLVKPGAKAQISHRDYHLGFQDAAACAQFPKAMQVASQFLTLQGAVAHSNMPLESGPTRLLPFSQRFEEGYMAYRIPEFQDFFLENYVALPLEMGDGMFFNPALFHAAGQNDSESVMRSANLLQISAAFGKPMETIDTYSLIEKTWAGLREMYDKEGLSWEVKALVGNVAEGYPFPTNLDVRVPESAGMAPDSEQDVVMKGLVRKWSAEKILGEIRQLKDDSRA